MSPSSMSPSSSTVAPESLPLIGPFLDSVGRHSTLLLGIGVAVLLILAALQLVFFLRTRNRLSGETRSWGAMSKALAPYALPIVGDNVKLVIARPFGEVIDEWLRDEWEDSWCSRIGSVYTSVALTFTFLLIAAVLHHDVGPAIEIADKKLLSSAVANMGAKFFISFTGAALAVFIDHFLFQSWLIRSHIYSAKKDAVEFVKPGDIDYRLGGGAGGDIGNNDGNRPRPNGGGGGGLDAAALARLRAAITGAGGGKQ